MKLKIIPVSKNDWETTYRIKRIAHGPVVAEKWGWDDTLQRDFHNKHWQTYPFSLVYYGDELIGTVSILDNNDHWVFGDFNIVPEFQKKGLGTKILSKVLADAKSKNIPVRLCYLKWNRVGSLYRKMGFTEIGEREFHYDMEWQPEEL